MDTKPVSNIESETRPSDVESDVMAPASLKCTAYETGDLEQTVAAPVLGIHSGRGTPSGRHNKLQKLDRPVLMMRCSQQDFGFFKEELRRYATTADTTDASTNRADKQRPNGEDAPPAKLRHLPAGQSRDEGTSDGQCQQQPTNIADTTDASQGPV